MTLTRFVTKNAFRNKRRSILTVLSIAVSLLLLTLMMTIWRRILPRPGQRGISAETGGAASRFSDVLSARLTTGRRFARFPGSWRWFRSHGSAEFTKTRSRKIFLHSSAPIPTNSSKFIRDMQIPADQVTAWQRDRQGVIVNDTLATKYGWKLGDRIVLQGTIYPINLELIIRGIFHSQPGQQIGLLQREVCGRSRRFLQGAGRHLQHFGRLSGGCSKIASTVDDMFRNSPQPTKTESEKAFGLEFVAMLGNVKAFILSICSAVVFTTLLVSANTMAMSIRERTREVAVLKTLGFTRRGVLGLFVSEAVALSLAGGLIGAGRMADGLTA